MQIRELEAALGASLVERGRREVVITPDRARGRCAGPGASSRRCARSSRSARWDRGLAGRLRIGVIPTVAPYLLPSALPLLRARNLALDLGVREAQTDAWSRRSAPARSTPR